MRSILSIKSLLTIFILSLLFIACNEKTDEKVVEADMNDVKVQLETTAHDIDAEIDNLEAKLDTAGDDVSESIKAKIAELENLKSRAENKLDDLSKVADEDWDDAKSDFHSFVGDLKSDWDDAKKDL